MEKKDQKSRIMRLLAQVVIIMAGLSVYAAGVALFVLPMDMIAAGTTGLGLVAQHYWGIPLSIFVAGFNILMFVVGLVELGKEFALSTLVATFYYPFALEQATRLVGDMSLRMIPSCARFFRRYDRICPGHRDPGRCLHRRHGYPAAGTEKEVRDPGVCYHVCDGFHGTYRPDDLWRQGEDPVRPDHGHDVYHYPG